MESLGKTVKTETLVHPVHQVASGYEFLRPVSIEIVSYLYKGTPGKDGKVGIPGTGGSDGKDGKDGQYGKHGQDGQYGKSGSTVLRNPSKESSSQVFRPRPRPSYYGRLNNDSGWFHWRISTDQLINHNWYSMNIICRWTTWLRVFGLVQYLLRFIFIRWRRQKITLRRSKNRNRRKYIQELKFARWASLHTLKFTLKWHTPHYAFRAAKTSIKRSTQSIRACLIVSLAFIRLMKKRNDKTCSEYLCRWSIKINARYSWTGNIDESIVRTNKCPLMQLSQIFYARIMKLERIVKIILMFIEIFVLLSSVW